MKDDVCALEQPERAQRQEVFCAGAGADQIDRSGCPRQRIIPAPTVLFVDSSITMNAPVARLPE
jgi:hypothetical protein